MPKTMISARIPEKLGEELEALAAATNRSKAYILTQALEELVERNHKLNRAIEQAVKDADESGAYVSHDKMEAWMLSLGTDHELPPPEPDSFRKPE